MSELSDYNKIMAKMLKELNSIQADINKTNTRFKELKNDIKQLNKQILNAENDITNIKYIVPITYNPNPDIDRPLEYDYADYNLTKRTWGCLRRVGFASIRDLTYVSMYELKHIKGLGRQSLENIKEFAKARGFYIHETQNCLNEAYSFEQYDKAIIKEPFMETNPDIMSIHQNVITIQDKIDVKDLWYLGRFTMRSYKCKTYDDKTVYLTPGQIEKYRTP